RAKPATHWGRRSEMSPAGVPPWVLRKYSSRWQEPHCAHWFGGRRRAGLFHIYFTSEAAADPKELAMQVRHFMTPVVVLLHPDRTVKEAAERMSELNIGVLPIGEADKVIGILTDRDIVIRSVAAGHDPLMERVRDVMTPEVIYCLDDQDVEEAQQLM